MAQIRSKPFGVTKEGANVTEYILSNPGGMSVSVLDYGCVIKNIIVPAKNGPVDVVLGHDTMADYENDFTSSGSTCCGAFVGRYANRIENAVFTLGGNPEMEQKLTKGGTCRYFTTESEERFRETARIFLHEDVNVNHVNIDSEKM